MWLVRGQLRGSRNLWLRSEPHVCKYTCFSVCNYFPLRQRWICWNTLNSWDWPYLTCSRPMFTLLYVYFGRDGCLILCALLNKICVLCLCQCHWRTLYPHNYVFVESAMLCTTLRSLQLQWNQSVQVLHLAKFTYLDIIRELILKKYVNPKKQIVLPAVINNPMIRR